jgi:hypothetical protein
MSQMNSYCPSCQQNVHTGASRCPNCAFDLNPSNGVITTIIRHAVRPKIQAEVDLAFTLDVTGSSTAFADGIPKTLQIICDQVQAKAALVKVSVQTHRDFDFDAEPLALRLDRGTIDEARLAVQNLQFFGGGDAPESHLDAIEHLANTVPWKLDPRARGALIAIVNAESKPLRSGRSAAELGEDLRKRSILLYLVCEPTPLLDELAQAAGGMLLPISNSPSATDLQKVSSQVSASIVASVASGTKTITMNSRSIAGV